MKLNLYFLSHILSCLVVFVFSLFAFIKNRKSKVNQNFFIFGSAIAVWLLFSSIAIISNKETDVVFWYRMSYIGITLIPYTFFYFVSALTGRKARLISIFNWLSASFFIIFLWSSNLFVNGVYKYNWGYYPRASLALHPIFIIIFVALFSYTIISLLLKITSKSEVISNIEKLRLKYALLGTLFGVFGSIDFLANYGINIYPFGFIFMMIFPCVYTYAIVKYRLMDIRLLFTRAGIFIFVYSFIFALPIWFGIKTKAWLWSLVLMGVLSPVGIFVYSYLREQTEKILLKKEANYQAALKELAKTMMQIRALDDLLNIIILRIFDAIQPQFIAFYIFSKDDKKYVLKQNRIQGNINLEKDIPINSALVNYLEKRHRSILVEETSFLKFSLETVAIPCFIQNGLFAFIVLGPKPKKALYTASDFVIFDIVSSEASLAIENCLFWQEEKTRLAKEEQIRRQRAMDHFSASLAHEIDNPIFAVTGITDVVKMTVTADLKDCIPQDKLNFLSDRLSRITKDLFRISKMIRAIREFSSQTKGEQVTLKLDDILDDFLSIVEPQFKYEGIFFDKQIEQGINLKGNKIHLEEVFINLATNAIHAVKHNGQKEKKITFKVSKNTPKTFLIELSDNGYGIKKEMLEDIFLDFVTTKASTEGTGMGLGRVRKIIEDHGGKVWASSKGAGTGATFSIELPFV